MTDFDKFKKQFFTLSGYQSLSDTSFILHFLDFLSNGSSQPSKPYIHFVALEKTNLLSYKVSEKSVSGLIVHDFFIY